MKLNSHTNLLPKIREHESPNWIINSIIRKQWLRKDIIKETEEIQLRSLENITRRQD